MADWNAIKTEYITTDTSYRKLADKYGISHVQIGNVGKQEGWVQLREQYLDKTLAKTLAVTSSQTASRAAKLQGVAETLLEKIGSLVATSDLGQWDTQSIRHITGALRDIKEIQMIRSDADMREQEARIKKLQKEAQEEAQKDNTIVIQFAEGSEEFGK